AYCRLARFLFFGARVLEPDFDFGIGYYLIGHKPHPMLIHGAGLAAFGFSDQLPRLTNPVHEVAALVASLPILTLLFLSLRRPPAFGSLVRLCNIHTKRVPPSILDDHCN